MAANLFSRLFYGSSGNPAAQQVADESGTRRPSPRKKGCRLGLSAGPSPVKHAPAVGRKSTTDDDPFSCAGTVRKKHLPVRDIVPHVAPEPTLLARDSLPEKPPVIQRGKRPSKATPDVDEWAPLALPPEPKRQELSMDETEYLLPVHAQRLVPDRILGKGSFGVVYEVIWNGHRSAHKKMRLVNNNVLAGTLDRELWERSIQHEHDILIRFTGHPLFVQIMAMYERDSENMSSLLLELGEHAFDKYCPTFIADHPSFPGPKSNSYAAYLNCADQLVEAVAYMHSQGILHLDLKPHNTLVFPDPNKPRGKQPRDYGALKKYQKDEAKHKILKISDFGIAKELALGTYIQTKYQPAYSLPYRAPEIKNENRDKEGFFKLTHAIDVFGLGTMLRNFSLVSEFPADRPEIKKQIDDLWQSARHEDPTQRPRAADMRLFTKLSQ